MKSWQELIENECKKLEHPEKKQELLELFNQIPDSIKGFVNLYLNHKIEKDQVREAIPRVGELLNFIIDVTKNNKEGIEKQSQFLKAEYSEWKSSGTGKSFVPVFEHFLDRLNAYSLPIQSAHGALPKPKSNLGKNFTTLLSSDDLEIYVTGCGGYGTKKSGQTKVTDALKEGIKKSDDKTQKIIILTGDNIYPVGTLSSTQSMIEPQISPYVNLAKDCQVTCDAILGNHESGAINPLAHYFSAAHGKASELMARRDHIAKLINSTDINCFPYFSHTFIRSEKEDPVIEIIYIDSTTLHIDAEQQKWLKKAMENSRATRKILVSHHAIGETLGKRCFVDDESGYYGYYSREGRKVIGNHHQTLREVFIDLDIFKYLKDYICLVSHDHFLGVVSHPVLGKVIFTGGGATTERTPSVNVMEGQCFPPLCADFKKQKAENEKAKTPGFVKLTINTAPDLKTDAIIQLIDTSNNVIFDSVQYTREPIPFSRETLQDLLETYYDCTFTTMGRHHFASMDCLIQRISKLKAGKLPAIKEEIQKEYDSLMSARGLTLLPSRKSDELRPVSHTSQGTYIQTLHTALVYLAR
jgi:hypothetical protein